MEAFWISTGLVALAEMGDKTQLLSLVLAARFRRPWPIVWGILVATLANHALAGALGAFGTTVVAFFLAEMGDKTQIATVMLAAQYQAWAWVVAGTTLGMMLANAPVVWLGERITRRVPIRLVHGISAVLFAALGVAALLY
jgi:putative Ca2+/H+ antiporter (TMEM165/GDT1 family)